jgi:hypothetical protein
MISIVGRVLGPFEDLLQANLMLGGLNSVNGARARRTYIVFAEAGDGNRDGFVEALRVFVDAMENAATDLNNVA